MAELYNKRFENYDNECDELSDVRIDKLDQKLQTVNLKLMIMIMMDVLQKNKKK